MGKHKPMQVYFFYSMNHRGVAATQRNYLHTQTHIETHTTILETFRFIQPFYSFVRNCRGVKLQIFWEKTPSSSFNYCKRMILKEPPLFKKS